jgi:hypothetical protein
MPETNLNQAIASDLTNAVSSYSVNASQLDTAGQQKETFWYNSNFTKYNGYYKTIPELKTAIDALARWTVGKGFVADEITTIQLSIIKGWGKDNFNSILENMIRVMKINGDSYAEIIRDEDKNIINLKPLDPSVMMHVCNEKGIIIRYEQISRFKGTKNKIFQPENIFHLSNKRVGDEIHGVSIIEAIENIILMRNEAMSDWKRVLHRNIDPLWIFHLDTDDTNVIASFKSKMDAARGAGENMYIPKGAVVPELISTAQNAGLNPLPWIENLNSYFFQAVGVPDIIVGSSKVLTEASAKIAYLAFEQTIEEEQLFIEEEVLSQLNIYINLQFPASLQNEVITGNPRPEVNNPEVEFNENANEKNDVTAEMEGRK